MLPLARSLLALALAALLHGACARHFSTNPHRQPPALPGRYCNKHEIGNATIEPSKDFVTVTQVFKTKLGQDEYLINIVNFCSKLNFMDGKIGTHYVMTRESVTACAGTPVRVLDVGADVFSPVAAVCELTGDCGALELTVEQHCEKRAVAPIRRPE